MATPEGQPALPCACQRPTEQGGTVLPHATARELLNISCVTVSPMQAGGAGKAAFVPQKATFTSSSAL